jgi:hypothetical protein
MNYPTSSNSNWASRLIIFMVYIVLHYVIFTFLTIYSIPHDVAQMVRLVFLVSALILLLIWMLRPRLMGFAIVIAASHLTANLITYGNIDFDVLGMKYLFAVCVLYSVPLLLLFWIDKRLFGPKI